MSSTLGHGSGPSGRIERLRRVVTALMRYERLESHYYCLDEARGYAERIIHLAVRNGDSDKMTMETANYWLLEKDLVQKLFNVLAPRYSNYTTSFTQMHVLPCAYPGPGGTLGILELKGNPWPSVLPKERNTKRERLIYLSICYLIVKNICFVFFFSPFLPFPFILSTSCMHVSE
ncbi:RP-L17 [Acanthosepion pharaonis]|uniref:Large ribosomal subunit protein bL17m n=1 Tax=Acanthosepion pharaonis TaxID=158019 RepID=A0A812CVR4_ACAPH|nr:RP-L17 [Sepia pharaonis]